MSDEVQILKGPDLTVTDRRVIASTGETAVAKLAAPQMDRSTISTSVTPLVATIGLGLFAAGALIRVSPMWMAGLAIAAFSPLARVRRPGYIVTAEVGGQRQPMYSTRNEGDAKLAVAALVEALRRRADTQHFEGQ